MGQAEPTLSFPLYVRFLANICIISIIFLFLPGIMLRKIGMSTDEICQAVYDYDLEKLPLEYVEMLPRFIPNEQELKVSRISSVCCSALQGNVGHLSSGIYI